ncbi:MAG: transglycosylase SLT domain-containing protein [Pseudomonadales bacterium]
MRITLRTVVAALTLVLLANTAVVGASTNLEQQRQKFIDAKAALAKGKTTDYKKLKAQLKDYPLYPYLDFADLLGRLRHAKPSDVDLFLNTYQDTSVAARLRYHYLEKLRKYDRWQTYLSFYQSEGATVEQQCFYQLARYRDGDTDAAMEEAITLWLVGKSQPKACDKLFGVLQKSGKITNEIAWERYTKAVLAHQFTLARYLTRFFTTDQFRREADEYMAVDRSPARIGKYSRYTKQDHETAHIIYHGLTHLAKSAPLDAWKHWHHYRQQLPFDQEQLDGIAKALTQGLYAAGYEGRADDLLREEQDHLSSSLLEWRLRKALAEQDWPTVRFWVQRLPEETRSSDRWRYWMARAEEQLLVPENGFSEDFYALAKTRSFYGFLAADLLQQPYYLGHSPVQIDPSVKTSVALTPGIVRARELFYVGEFLQGRRELYLTGKSFDSPQWQATAVLTNNWGWHSQTILSMIKAGYWNDINLRFPVLYKDAYEKRGQQNALDASMLMAITRQESAFDPGVISRSGARGLMQLMPATAKYIAKKRKISYNSKYNLDIPEKNIELGSTYYRYLMDDFDDNRVLSTAGYNAGPNRVRKWQKVSQAKMPADIWIELIPYRETRGYVMNVLAFNVIYGYHLGQATSLLTEKEQSSLL